MVGIDDFVSNLEVQRGLLPREKNGISGTGGNYGPQDI
jgi:hypothetical protein